MIPASPAYRKLAALALLAVVTGLLYALLALPLWNLFAKNREQLEVKKEYIARYDRLVSGGTEASGISDEWQRSGPVSRFLLTGSTHELAAANLQSRIKLLITETGGELTSIRNLAVSGHDAFSQVGVEIRISASIFTLQELLYSIEMHEPLLKVTEISINRKITRHNKRTARADQTGNEKIDARIHVSGFILMQDGHNG